MRCGAWLRLDGRGARPHTCIAWTDEAPVPTRAFPGRRGLIFYYSGGHFFGGGAGGQALGDDQLAAFNPDLREL